VSRIEQSGKMSLRRPKAPFKEEEGGGGGDDDDDGV